METGGIGSRRDVDYSIEPALESTFLFQAWEDNHTRIPHFFNRSLDVA